MKILLGATGSVASIKIPELVQLINSSIKDSEVRVITTNCSKHFFDFEAVKPHVENIYDDTDEWNTWNKIGDPVLHIELRRWADVFVIAPTDANTMAKMANGICDNILTCIVRAWDCRKPLLYCPAMNTYMWDHPITNKHRKCLKEFGYIEVPCVSKTLACGDKGMGAMALLPTIISEIKKFI